LSILLDNNFTS